MKDASSTLAVFKIVDTWDMVMDEDYILTLSNHVLKKRWGCSKSSKSESELSPRRLLVLSTFTIVVLGVDEADCDGGLQFFTEDDTAPVFRALETRPFEALRLP